MLSKWRKMSYHKSLSESELFKPRGEFQFHPGSVCYVIDLLFQHEWGWFNVITPCSHSQSLLTPLDLI